MWAVKSLNIVVSANRVVARGWEGGECGIQRSFGERRFVLEQILTGVMAILEP